MAYARIQSNEGLRSRTAFLFLGNGAIKTLPHSLHLVFDVLVIARVHTFYGEDISQIRCLS